LIIEEYRQWLRELVDHPAFSTFGVFFDVAWETRFVATIPNDDNRAADGLALRQLFEEESSVTLPWLGECRILEFLVALSKRLSIAVYAAGEPDTTASWFWRIVLNLYERTPFRYKTYAEEFHAITKMLDRFNNRKYMADGRGGLFPLIYPSQDQREVEIWYQMQAYLRENM